MEYILVYHMQDPILTIFQENFSNLIDFLPTIHPLSKLILVFTDSFYKIEGHNPKKIIYSFPKMTIQTESFELSGHSLKKMHHSHLLTDYNCFTCYHLMMMITHLISTNTHRHKHILFIVKIIFSSTQKNKTISVPFHTLVKQQRFMVFMRKILFLFYT